MSATEKICTQREYFKEIKEPAHRNNRKEGNYLIFHDPFAEEIL